MLKLFSMTDSKIKQKVQIVVATDSSVLLLKLSDDRGGFWQNATGSVEFNEEFLEAAERELLEETGLKKPLIELPMEIKFHDRWGFDVIEKVFYCHLVKELKIKLSSEHQGHKWVKFSKLTKNDYEFDNHFEATKLARKSRT
jgi:8-oxo-dGTP pyrophosphatase MutT (NUDIX family)